MKPKLTENEQYELAVRQAYAPFASLIKIQQVVGPRFAWFEHEDGAMVEYEHLHSAGLKMRPGATVESFATEDEAVDSYKKHLTKFLKGKTGVLYWRNPPRAQQEPGGTWTVRSRLAVH
mgnify:CR=1 FL=1